MDTQEFRTALPQRFSPLVTPRYLAGYFDSNGSIFFIVKDEKMPQLRASITEKNSDGTLTTLICLQYGMGRIVPTHNGMARLLLVGRPAVKQLAQVVAPFTILKRPLVTKTLEVVAQMEMLEALRNRRPPMPKWDKDLEAEIEVGRLDLYDLIAEHDAIRTGRGNGNNDS